MQKILRRLRLVATIAAVATATGCMGSFALTKMVYGWNESVTGNKIINNVIFWGLNILPVYSIAVTVDVVILNTIEFWTGTKLIADASVEGDTRVAVSERDDGALVVTRGAVVYTLIPESADQIRIEKDGVFVGTATRQADGSIVAEDAAGEVLSALDATEVQKSSEVVAAALDG